ncbi:FAD-binding oxidoreductase [Paralimibaculum aggregatum]|uniref:FAD-binding oxidoreductase n=1 Tax=Paralimibaculum aggregatum TaxID=3036245 RepID=A0ABQ6LJQ8_9RHOB|nr:FAD-binding oxidoreductase [Limibaculum sp. NKW23]GMG83490.1 FAD-binding oxidoreductase [Limibaculum sp. NKW23]
MGYLTANDRPGEHAASWYAASVGEIPERPALAGAAKADVCIVGGGYAGLSAALHLAERGYDTVLLDANRMGWGASGRNGGQLGVGPRAEMADYVRLCGRETAARAWEIAVAANRLVRELIDRHAIDCDLMPGYVEAAWKPAHARELAEWAEAAARDWGHAGIVALSREEVAARLGTTRYHGGFHEPEGAHLHPLKLALGLARAAEGAGARLLERSRVTRIAPGRVETAAGHVAAEHILLACNGYLDGLEGRVQARSMPINNFILATEPLDRATADRINPGRVAVCDTKFVLNYYRLTPDLRLLWGGGESYGRRFPRDIPRLVRRAMAEIYPELAGIPHTHAWGGTLAITGTRMPAFQDLGQGMRAISGWSGSGIHMATMGGLIAAEAIAGTAERWDVMARLPTPAFPGGDWFRAPLLAAAMTWYALRDRL